MKLSQILHKDEYTSACSAEDVEIEGICSDTRHEIKGNLFVCIKGTRFDAHCLLGYVKDKGAAAVLVEEGFAYDTSLPLPVFRVKNTRAMLSLLWSRFCGEPEKGLKIIGITGTNGKTSCAFMLHTVLLAGGISAGLIGTVGCYVKKEPLEMAFSEDDGNRLETMTTPDPDLLFPILREMADRGVTHVVMEVSSHALHFDKCADMQFEMGIFTNLASDHMDLHETKEAYRQAKEKLFTRCKVGIWNADDAEAEKMIAHASCRHIRCSAKEKADFYIKNKQMRGMNGLSYMLCGSFGRLTVSMQIPGEFTVYNSLLAAVAALTLGVSPKAVREGLGNLRGVRGRLERVDTGEQDFTVIIDYAHTEEAMRNVLATVRALCIREERIVAVFGCGGDRDQSKRSHMGKAAEELADFSIITTDNQRSEDPKQIILDILKGFTDKEKRKVILDREKAITYAITEARPRDVILLIGKGHETYQLCGKEKHPFDERKIVAQAIKMREAAHTNEDEHES